MNIEGMYTTALGSKVPLISEILYESNCLSAILVETHLNEEMFDAEIHIPGYTPYRSDRINRIKGGVIIYLKDYLAGSTDVIFKYCNRTVECIAIHIKSLNMVIVGLYRPPDCTSSLFNPVLKKLEEVLDSLPSPVPEIHMMGDFNFPFVKWKIEEGINIGTIHSGGLTDEQIQFKNLAAFAEKYLLCQLIDEPTRENNVLDLCYTNFQEAYHNISIHKSSFSDHNVIMMDTKYICEENSNKHDETPENITGFKRLNFFDEKVDWSKIKSELKDITWEQELVSLSVNDMTAYICDTVLKICTKFTPETSKVTRQRKNKIPKYNRYLMRRRTRINHRLEKLPPSPQREKLVSERYEIEQKIRNRYREKRKAQEAKATAAIKTNSKFFFSYANSLSRIRTEIGPLISNVGKYITSPKSICETFKVQYESVFTQPKQEKKVTNPWDFFKETQDSDLCNIDFNESDIIDALKELSNCAAPGPDNFPAIVLKTCSEELAKPLYLLLRKSLTTGTVPDALKEAIISPIFKGGSICKGKAKNYRPIALTSHIMKVFEKVIRKKIVKYFDERNSFNVNQHGFRAGRSCLSQLLGHYDYILSQLEQGKNVDVIYLDFAKAFDKVDHGILLHKLRDMGIKGQLGVWIHSFLTDRYQYVAVNRSKSSKSSVISGVPQGSVLGPLLFVVHIGDIDSETLSSFVSLFADDTRAAAGIKDEECHRKLQLDLNTIYKWAEQNNMKFNDSKFEKITYGRNEALKDIPYIAADGSNIQASNEVKDLGVTMSDNASFKTHITKLSSKASQLTSWVLRTFITREKYVMLMLWKTLILSRLEGCSPLWNPMMTGDILSLENVQRSYTRHVHGMNNLDYWERLKSLKLYSLQRRRERYDILYVWKILEQIVPNVSSVSNRQVQLIDDIGGRRGRLCKIPNPAKNAALSTKTLVTNSFTIRATKLFNVLPKCIREISGCELDTFKEALDEYLAILPDRPAVHGYSTENNSLLDVVPATLRRMNEGLRPFQSSSMIAVS